MATDVTAQRLDYDAVEVTENSVALSTLYWYEDGRLIASGVYPRSRIFTLQEGASRAIEVLDTTAAPEEQYPGEFLIVWYAEQAAAPTYKVQRWDFVDEEWDDERIVISAGEEVFNHLTPWISDGTVVRYRVLPVSEENIEGEALQFDWTVVCRPDAPDTEATFDEGTGQVTVDMAA